MNENPNWSRGMVMLSRIQTPQDLVDLWRMCGSLRWGPLIERHKPWWVDLPI